MRVDALVAVIAQHEQAARGHLHRNEIQARAAGEAQAGQGYIAGEYALVTLARPNARTCTSKTVASMSA